MSRRGLLVAGAAGAGALAGGCGAYSRRREREPDDAEVLNGLLELELASVAFYEGERGSLARRLLAHEREHAARLQEAIRDLGAEPSTRARARAREAGGMASARRLEETSVAAYLAALPRLARGELRATFAGALATEAEHLAAVRSRLGEEPSQQAFVTARPAP